MNNTVKKVIVSVCTLVICFNLTANCDSTTDTTFISRLNPNHDGIAPEFKKIITEEREIPYKETTRETEELFVGESKVVQEGKNGKACDTYQIVCKSGSKAEITLLYTEIIEPPVEKITEIGTKEKEPELKYSRVLEVTATAYDLSFASCGKYPGDKGYGITASGMYARRGCVAVDPKVIPLGTRLYIEAPDGSWSYGEAIAADTGGAIKGNKIDLFMDSYTECINFGRRSAIVYVLE